MYLDMLKGKFIVRRSYRQNLIMWEALRWIRALLEAADIFGI